MPDPLVRAFAGLCREMRMELDVTQGQLATAARVSRGHIASIEAGRGNPTLEVASRIATALGVELELSARRPIVPVPRQRDLVHARCAAYAQRRLEAAGMVCRREVPIIDGRLRGWIDLLAFDGRTGRLYVIEIKTRFDDLGAVERQVAWYASRAGAIARAAGWRVTAVRSWLLCLASEEVEGALRRNREALRQSFPGRGREMMLELAPDAGRAERIRPAGGHTSHPVHGTRPSGGHTPHPSRGTRPGAEAAGSPARSAAAPVSGLALIDPRSRRREWLIASGMDGRRRPMPYRDYADAAARLAAGPAHR